MKALFLLISLLTISTHAQTTLNITCTNPNLPYISAFSLTADFEGTATENDNQWLVRMDELEVTMRVRGNDSQTVERELPQLKGSMVRIDSDLTKKPYYSIKLFSQDKKVFVNINADYPNPLSSRIRLENGQVFKATCRL